ncbi:MAG: LPS export ABC transporter periplasmic protein LptC [Candidatus Scalinduaceae bacterium]
MRKRRFFFMGIIVICFLILALSISGLFEYTAYIKKEEQPMLKEIIDENSKKEQRLNLDINPKDITQEIYGLYLPNYDKDGKETSVIRGAYTVFIKNEIYRITKPEIEFLSTGDVDTNQPKDIIITSDFADIDKTTNKGFLYKNVITRLEEDLEIHTDDLKYLPDEKIINTDGPVTVKSKGMKITGTGFEISLADSTALIKNDPEMELESNKDNLFSLSKKSTPNSSLKNQTITTNKNTAEKLFIRSSGKLVFENERKFVTFHDDVRISKGKSTVFSDKLLISFDSDMKNIQKAITSGDVLASDGTKTAKGETLSWDAEKQIIILDDDPVAEFFDDKISINAARIMFFKNQGKMDVPVSGQLTTIVSTENENKEAKSFFANSNNNNETIKINWKGRMSFQQEKNQTIFEDDVIMNRGGTKLYCGKLLIINDEDGTVQKLEATKGVHLIEKKDNSFREARGTKMIWTSAGDYVDLYGSPLASFKDDERHISAPKIIFSEIEKIIFAEGKGNLLVKSSTKNKEDSELTKINWNEKMVYNGKNKTANFYKKVKVIKGNENLDCDKLDVFFDEEDKIKKVTATGNVYFATPKLENTEGIGTLLVWDLLEDVAVLSGTPLAELRRSGIQTFSEKIYFDINSQRVHWEGRPHWQIYEGLQ